MHTQEPSRATPKVAVLLATRNGRRWLPAQLETILDQEGVDVRVIALDDMSTDGTAEWIDDVAARDSRLIRLPSTGASGGSAANFYRLIERADITAEEYVAFADQDDLWRPGKLARHASILTSDFDGVSSNVTSFTSEGKRTLIVKDEPQRRLDFLLQSPGPGSTFLMSPRLFALARDVVGSSSEAVKRIDYHDSLVYVIARARGWRWHIDPEPTVDYRQHEHNVMGANIGIRSALSRLRLIRTHWHRQQAIDMTRIALTVASSDQRQELQRVLDLFTSVNIRSRFALARLAGQFRRKPRDRWIIAFLIGSGIW